MEERGREEGRLNEGEGGKEGGSIRIKKGKGGRKLRERERERGG